MEKISQIVILGEFLTLAETLRCFFLRSGGHASVHYQISTGFVLPITHAANLRRPKNNKFFHPGLQIGEG
jgi:hypothetical protein